MLHSPAVSRAATAVGSLAVVLALLGFVSGPPDTAMAFEPVTVSAIAQPVEVVYGRVLNKKAAPIKGVKVVVSYRKAGRNKAVASTKTRADGTYQTSFKGKCRTYRVKFTLPKSAGRTPSNNIRKMRMCPGYSYQVSAQLKNTSRARFLFLPITSY